MGAEQHYLRHLDGYRVANNVAHGEMSVAVAVAVGPLFDGLSHASVQHPQNSVFQDGCSPGANEVEKIVFLGHVDKRRAISIQLC